MKLLFVIQRFGLDVDGGAELYCRWLAEKCSFEHSVTVLTTTARDYITWKNHYPAGPDVVSGIPVIRMPVDQERTIDTFNEETARVLQSPVNDEMQEQWLRSQGPWSTELFEFLRVHHVEYDYLLFFTYLYCTSVCGSRICPDKSILVPMAHNEPVAYLPIFQALYSGVRGVLYLTSAEQEFVERTYPVHGTPACLLGTGVDLPPTELPTRAIREKYRLTDNSLVYIGRVEEGKGCGELIRFFEHYLNENRDPVQLILAGRLHMHVTPSTHMICPGFIPDSEIVPLIDTASVIVVPSPFESLSILLLQAFGRRKPVLVNARSPVLLHHVKISNGGLYYSTQEEFSETLHCLLVRDDLRRKLGENGYDYVHRYFTWDAVISRLNQFLIKMT
ncbi:glycosyltransferase family 4 protein [bacterium]|nr:glycosyltransferase family 4 protein [candidate division CSSED10-310 bacterium]